MSILAKKTLRNFLCIKFALHVHENLIFGEKLTLLATEVDWSKVAAQVHCETTVVAVRPIVMFPPASKAVSRFPESL